AQTGIDFEIIVVDDASTDRSAEIARSFSENLGQTAGGSPDEGVRGYASRAGTDAWSSTDYVGADALVRPRPAELPPDDRIMPRVTVLSAPPLPDNWTGKNNAMSAGAKIAKAK